MADRFSPSLGNEESGRESRQIEIHEGGEWAFTRGIVGGHCKRVTLANLQRHIYDCSLAHIDDVLYRRRRYDEMYLVAKSILRRIPTKRDSSHHARSISRR